jgi:uncharacterized protein (TIGR02271 family)
MSSGDPDFVSGKIEIVEETLLIEKRLVETDRVTVRKSVETVEHKLEHTLATQDIGVEHVPIGHVVASMPAVREENGLLIVPIVEERIVVSTELFLREEIHIRRTDGQQTIQQTVPLRRDVVHIEQTSALKTAREN